MRALLLSAVLYLVGIALTLLFRPSLMFHPDGRWKEFGTISSEHTVFPFWMFCIVWAIVSYVFVSIIMGEGGTEKLGAASVTTGTLFSAKHKPAAESKPLHKEEPPEDLVSTLPIRTKKKRNSLIHTEYGNMKPGYYVLDRKAAKESGIPKYIYLGSAPSEEIVTSGGAETDSDTGTGHE